MSSMVSRWPVLISATVTTDDVDGEGMLRAEAVERLFGQARDVYLASCRTLEGRELEVRDVVVTASDTAVAPGQVTVSVSAVEVFPDRFTMNARIRPAAVEGIAADAACSVAPDGPVTDEIRDELIALAHAARHYH